MSLKGYIALLDVLGFSELISRETRGRELERYFAAIDQATNKIGGVQYVLFSDTIVIYTPSNGHEDLLELLKACSYAMHYLLREGLPVRGAVSYGSYYRSRSQKGVIIAGQAFIEAYHFEKAQDWVGITLAPSVLRKVPTLEKKCQLAGADFDRNSFQERSIWTMIVQPCHSIPWHSTGSHRKDSLDGFAVVPISPNWSFEDLPTQLQRVKEYLKREQLLAGNPSAQAKYEEPIHWIDKLSREWALFLGHPDPD